MCATIDPKILEVVPLLGQKFIHCAIVMQIIWTLLHSWTKILNGVKLLAKDFRLCTTVDQRDVGQCVTVDQRFYTMRHSYANILDFVTLLGKDFRWCKTVDKRF